MQKINTTFIKNSLQNKSPPQKKNCNRFIRKTIWGAPAEAGLTRSNNLKKRRDYPTTTIWRKARENVTITKRCRREESRLNS
jgi:hypothetical protein